MTDVLERADVLARARRELDRPDGVEVYEKSVAWHIWERDGDAEEAKRVALERVRDQQERLAYIAGVKLIQRRVKLVTVAAKLGIILPPNFDQPDLTALADKARALIVQNDPDAVRAGLAEIADALDGIVRDWDPLAKLRGVQRVA